MRVNFSILIIFTILFSACSENNLVPEESTQSSLIQRLAENRPDREGKLALIDSVYSEVPNVSNDSIRKELLLELSYQSLKTSDSTTFLRINEEARKLSLSLKDSSGVAATFWDLAHFYHDNNQEDSTYSNYTRAQKIYQSIGDEFNSARLLLNMAIIQREIKDFTGSEVSTTNAIILFKPLKKYKYLYSAYNNLGIIFNELESYERSLEYYKKALYYLEKSDEPLLYPSIWNNMGMVYQRSKQYGAASNYFKKALNFDPNLVETNPRLYAMVLDNLAYTNLKIKDTVGIYSNFIEALKIRQNIDDASGISINQLHLAEYFLEKEDTLKALYYAKKVNEFSKKNQILSNQLSSLKFLSSIEKNDRALNYLNRYISLNDSLYKEERAVRNKYVRIRFETDQYISEAETLNQRIWRISLISLGVIIILIFLYLINSQRGKNKILKQKEIANQEIYNLVLEQQIKFEKGREREKHYISGELHDGVLGRLFGIRLNLDSLNEENNENSKKERLHYIKEIQNVSDEIRSLSHRLRKNHVFDVNFNSVLEELINENSNEKLYFELHIDPDINWNSIENDIKLNVYRILQEAVMNIIKHSNADKAFINFIKSKSGILLTIRDNGKGFNKDNLGKGIGIKNIEQRVNILKGNISFENNHGTLISMVIPLTKKN